MVSTRGVQFKFTEGEKVLCYEPDPTKARVLYESKVLDQVVGRDERGKKVAEYLIHFLGWNSSWDRCVREEFILSYTDENQALQVKLAGDAALTLKGKRKSKLPAFFKETLVKRQCAEDVDGSEKNSESNSDADSEDEYEMRHVKLELPETLKRILEEDWYRIRYLNKLVYIPCVPNVVDILEGYIKYLAAKLLCVSPPKNARNGKHLMPDDVDKKLNFCKETVHGLRIYFDFTLSGLLLYDEEREQFNIKGSRCCSKGSNVNDKLEIVVKSETIQTETEMKSPGSETVISKIETIVPKTEPEIDSTFIKSEPVSPKTSQSPRSFLRQRRGRTLKKYQKMVVKLRKIDFTSKKEVKLEEKFPSIASATAKIVKKKYTKRRIEPSATRILRSSLSTPKHERNSTESNMAPEPQELSPSELNSELTDINIPRLTRKSLRKSMSPPPQSPNKTSPSQPGTSKDQSSCMSPPPSLRSSSCVKNSDSLPAPSISKQLRSSERITSTPQTSRLSNSVTTTSRFTRLGSSTSSMRSSQSGDPVDQQYHLIKNAGLLEEVMSWKMLPQEYYQQEPVEPSLVYGAVHLLRLFVKLPELVSKMRFPRKQNLLHYLVKELEDFILYMDEQKDELFLPSSYADAHEDIS